MPLCATPSHSAARDQPSYLRDAADSGIIINGLPVTCDNETFRIHPELKILSVLLGPSAHALFSYRIMSIEPTSTSEMTASIPVVDAKEPEILQYTDGEGVIYELHPDFAEGDIVLLTGADDRIAYKMSKSVLGRVSAFFGDMFTNPHYTGAEIHLTIEDGLLYTFLSFINNPNHRISRTWLKTFALIDTAHQYQCERLAHHVLYAACDVDPREHRFEAFARASEHNHLPTACRILRLAGRGEKVGTKDKLGKSLRPETWTPMEVGRFRSQWIWALGCAVQYADSIYDEEDRIEARTKEPYWKTVIGEFMIRMTL